MGLMTYIEIKYMTIRTKMTEVLTGVNRLLNVLIA